jgi:hypothetical protein
VDLAGSRHGTRELHRGIRNASSNGVFNETVVAQLVAGALLCTISVASRYLDQGFRWASRRGAAFGVTSLGRYAMTTPTIVECPWCGHTLGIPSDLGTIHVTCPRCRQSWDWPKDQAAIWYREDQGRPGDQAAISLGVTIEDATSLRGSSLSAKRRSRGSTPLWIAIYVSIGLAIAVYSGLSGYRDALEAPPRPLPHREVIPPKPLPPRDARESERERPDPITLPEEPLPENGDGVFRFDWAGATSKLRVVPRSQQGPMIVKVEEGRDADAQLVCWFLVRAGESAEIAIPPGSYHLRFASGKRWYGEEHLFGPQAVYSALANPLVIPADTVYTLHLTPSRAGTLRELRIGPNDF